MSEPESQVELRCRECNKRFEKQTTLKRHGYYCRSRRTGHRTRLRACISCAEKKSACDRKQPRCARCAIKDIICAYPADGLLSRAGTSHEPASVERDPSRHALQEAIVLRAVQDGPSTHDGLTAVSSDIADPAFSLFDWDDAEIHLTNLIDFNIQDATMQLPVAQGISLDEDGQTDDSPQWTPMLNTSIGKSPNNHNRLLIQRPENKHGMYKIARLILQTLKSYPLMLKQNTLPPYIHTSVLPWHVGNSDTEPLANCFSLMHMVSSGVEASWKLFWKNANLECERMLHERHTMSRYELLAAIQALSIYLLIRLDQGETEHNNIEFLLISAVTAVSKQLACSVTIYETQPNLSEHDVESEWKDWIFKESLRRVCVIYQIANMLVYFEPAAMCEKPLDFFLAPLPARKQLWEAEDAHSWRTEVDNGIDLFGLAISGEISYLNEDRANGLLRNRSTTGPWEQWCSGVDGFGGLVMLAATLLV